MNARPGRRITGERVMTAAGGFNPTWQRHVAAYGECEQLLPPGRVLDLGCGIGHSYELLAPRETVGRRPRSERPRRPGAGDLRRRHAGAAAARRLVRLGARGAVDRARARSGARAGRGCARAATTRRRGVRHPEPAHVCRPDEIVDPYHYVEYDAKQLEDLCAPFFGQVEAWGLMGSPRYLELVAEHHARLDALLAKDPLRLRRFLPRRLRQLLYDRQLARERRAADPRAAATVPADFWLAEGTLDDALDLVAVCHVPVDQMVAGASVLRRHGNLRSRNGRSTSS